MMILGTGNMRLRIFNPWIPWIEKFPELSWGLIQIGRGDLGSHLVQSIDLSWIFCRLALWKRVSGMRYETRDDHLVSFKNIGGWSLGWLNMWPGAKIKKNKKTPQSYFTRVGWVNSDSGLSEPIPESDRYPFGIFSGYHCENAIENKLWGIINKCKMNFFFF